MDFLACLLVVLVLESRAPGAVVSEVARRHGLTPQQLFGWRRQLRAAVEQSGLHMDCTAVGQTTHLAARMEQLATPGSILLTTDT